MMKVVIFRCGFHGAGEKSSGASISAVSNLGAPSFVGAAN
jgi:hypothetical protein